jgi:hypothetical protein
MAKRQVSRSVSDRALRAALTARARPLRLDPAQAASDQPARLAAAVRDRIAPAADSPLPLVEPIWSFWLDAAHLARLTTLLAARQIDAPMPGSSSIPKLDLPPSLVAFLTTWLNDHQSGARAAARAANYLAHYGLRLPAPSTPDASPRVKSSRFLRAFHAALVEALRLVPPADASHLLFRLRRLHVHLAQRASLIVEGVPPPDIFARLGESLSLGRADLLTAEWLLARPEFTAALRGPVLVPYPQPWMPTLDRLRQLTGAFDSLALFYDDLAATSEALLLSIRFGDWTQSAPPAAATWATFWRPDIARYLVAYQEVTGIALPSRLSPPSS